jgi:hypothetical protein
MGMRPNNVDNTSGDMWEPYTNKKGAAVRSTDPAEEEERNEEEDMMVKMLMWCFYG